MANREMLSLQDFQVNVAEAAVAADGSTVGAIVDTADFGPGVGFVITLPAYTDGDFTLTFEDGDDIALSDAAAIPAAQVKAYDALPTAVGSSRYSVDSNRRYVRPTLVAANVTTGATAGVLFVGGKEIAP